MYLSGQFTDPVVPASSSVTSVILRKEFLYSYTNKTACLLFQNEIVEIHNSKKKKYQSIFSSIQWCFFHRN